MKTNIPYMIILLIAGALVSWQKGPATGSGMAGTEKSTIANGLPAQGTKALVQYKVYVYQNQDVTVCGAYLVDIINSSGVRVAPPQMYSPGKESYVFTEQTRTGRGIRIARLIRVLPPDLEEFCPNWMWAQPDKENLNLSDQQVYLFHLLARINSND